jgi:hypothetical protein
MSMEHWWENCCRVSAALNVGLCSDSPPVLRILLKLPLKEEYMTIICSQDLPGINTSSPNGNN